MQFVRRLLAVLVFRAWSSHQQQRWTWGVHTHKPCGSACIVQSVYTHALPLMGVFAGHLIICGLGCCVVAVWFVMQSSRHGEKGPCSLVPVCQGVAPACSLVVRLWVLSGCLRVGWLSGRGSLNRNFCIHFMHETMCLAATLFEDGPLALSLCVLMRQARLLCLR